MSRAETFDRLPQLIRGRFVALAHRVERPICRGERANNAELSNDDSLQSAETITQGDHVDLMFEAAGTLETWALDRVPDTTPQVAWHLAPHRIAYLDYEGPISGNRGSVTRVIAGTFEREASSNAKDSAASLRLRLSISGEKEFRILSMQPINEQQWTIAFDRTRTGEE